jgi:hypothetical protein
MDTYNPNTQEVAEAGAQWAPGKPGYIVRPVSRNQGLEK